MTRDECTKVGARLRELEQEHRDRLRAGVRVERRLIHGQWVDVKVCPPSVPLGDVEPCQNFAEKCRGPLTLSE